MQNGEEVARQASSGAEATDKAPKVLRFAAKQKAAEAQFPLLHIYHGGAVCATERKGFPTPEGRSPLELVVDATEGFVPLWDREVTLRWRFQERSMLVFANPERAKEYIRTLFARALVLWGKFHPVRFTEVRDAWDFEIVVENAASCTPNGCTLARAFFPDSGQHDVVLYPTLFEQSQQEQIETMAHEIGHIFGLRHFFAELESAWPAELFGRQSSFTIMNYGRQSVMTDADREDLRTLYLLVWSGQLTNINGTPIRLTRPFSAMRAPVVPVAVAASQMPLPPVYRQTPGELA